MYFGPMNGEVVLEDNNIVCIFFKREKQGFETIFQNEMIRFEEIDWITLN